MKKNKKCPKCPGILLHFQSKTGASYDGCPICKGIWISRKDLPKIFASDKVSALFSNKGLEKAMPTKFACPDCNSFLQSGTVQSTDMTLEECTRCETYFFEDRELKRLYEEMQRPELPRVETPQIDLDKMIQTSSYCPVCKDQHLWGVKEHTSQFSSCLKCGGMASSVEALQKMAHKSLFSPSMFVFRPGQGDYAVCRHCSEAQAPQNKDCQKCGRELFRVNCTSCSGRMSEYILGDLIIERCQICNAVWLDDNEFERIMTAVPDVRRVYEAGVRHSELLEAQVLAASHVYRLGLEQSTRKIIDRFWGMYGVFFYSR